MAGKLGWEGLGCTPQCFCVLSHPCVCAHMGRWVGGVAYLRSCAHIHQWNVKRKGWEGGGFSSLFASLFSVPSPPQRRYVCISSLQDSACCGAIQMKQNQPHLVVLKMILFILLGSGRSTSFDMKGIKALSRSGSFPRNIICICTALPLCAQPSFINRS